MADEPISAENFQFYFERDYDLVYYWFVRRGLDPETSRDLAQETFLAAYKGLDTFRNESSVRTWLLRIARNIYRNFLRDKKTQKRSAIEISISGGQEDEEGELTEMEIADASDIGSEARALESERDAALYATLLDLPDQMRLCVELRLQDLKYREIAQIMGLSIETVKSHLYQARHRLRKPLGRESDRDRRKK